MIAVTTKLKSLLQDLKQRRLKSLQNLTFSELPADIRKEILMSAMSTKDYQNALLTIPGN